MRYGGMLHPGQKTLTYVAYDACYTTGCDDVDELLKTTRNLKSIWQVLKSMEGWSLLPVGLSMCPKDPNDLKDSHPELCIALFEDKSPEPSTFNETEKQTRHQRPVCRNSRTGCGTSVPSKIQKCRRLYKHRVCSNHAVLLIYQDPSCVVGHNTALNNYRIG